VIGAYQAQLAAEAAAAAAAVTDDTAQPASVGAKSSSKLPGNKAAVAGSRLGTPRHGKAGSSEAVLPPDVKLPEHGGFVAYFVDAGRAKDSEVGGGQVLGRGGGGKG
jgi:hypothetical protein